MKHIYWDKDALVVLDQRSLPAGKKYIRCRDAASVAEAIKAMAVRGAPLIGCAAAYGYALAAKKLPKAGWPAKLAQAAALLRHARPTAVNLMHAVDRMQTVADTLASMNASPAQAYSRLKAEADAMFEEDVRANKSIGRFGAALLKPGSRLITHCNAGALATCGWGTALGVIFQAHADKKISHVYSCETRPYLQGSRLTMWELMNEGVECSMITDNMAAHIMATERIDGVVVGADRIAANGDAANKIGTYGLAVLAQHHSIPFYVAAPTTTVDFKTATGEGIPIEERSAKEVVQIGERRVAPKGARARHPAFDVTPHRLITAIVTELGVVSPVNRETLAAVLQRHAAAPVLAAR